MKENILIVDDDLDFVDSLSLILGDYGICVETTTADIVAKVRKHKPNLIILDVMFPENPSAGFDAARALVAAKDVREIPVIMLSAVNQKSKLSFNFSQKDVGSDFLPVWEFVEKPVEPEVLKALVAKTLAKAKAGDRPAHLYVKV